MEVVVIHSTSHVFNTSQSQRRPAQLIARQRQPIARKRCQPMAPDNELPTNHNNTLSIFAKLRRVLLRILNEAAKWSTKFSLSEEADPLGQFLHKPMQPDTGVPDTHEEIPSKDLQRAVMRTLLT
ncbi:hypothetical protein EW146_g7290 [Bondarzewia mesenterica]|uniref:Uncharacterized protein n=1 Tax=Bondarzewia mesenterica TaxID=1095465 RepID=A0A4S4LLW5_9AGAM|nr:hypothetical protein EW146_g7290 [Bondarzewia mesenterica]